MVSLGQILRSEVLGKNFGNLGRKKGVYLSYDKVAGWTIRQFGLIQRFFRWLGFYSSTHLKHIKNELVRTGNVPSVLWHKVCGTGSILNTCCSSFSVCQVGGEDIAIRKAEATVPVESPVYDESNYVQSVNLLQSAYTRALESARAQGIGLLGLLPIGTGYPSPDAELIAICTIRQYMKSNPLAFDDVKLIVSTPEDYRKATLVFSKVDSLLNKKS